ncbi:MAG TPA: magnesium-translocating P-type ATPase [Stellaceae bacterium]|nr:magnesium-translocating P-type ATPase [Stellaceae bacterium]
MALDSSSEPKFWQHASGDLIRRLDSTLDGLSSAEAARRAIRYGPNILARAQRSSLPRKFISRFGNPLVLILLAAAAISAATGDLASFVIIATIVLVSAILDTAQEFRAEEAAERLKTSVALNERVLRDGREITLPGRDLVPGDLVLLAAGDLVPADGRVLEARDLFVNEALLTGESYPAEKFPVDGGTVGPEVAGAQNAVFMGSSVMNGSGRVMVCATGLHTELGRISAALRRAPPPTALEQGTRRFGLLIIRLTQLLVLFVLLVNALFHRPLLESFLFAVALAVGLTPELLPMIVSVTLARGAIRMAKAQVIVKRLGAIHDLGSMTVLCTDKTGTLTEARIRLAQQVSLCGQAYPKVAELARLNSYFQSGLRSPLDAAILEGGASAGVGWTKIDEAPFDFQRRRVSVLVERDGRRLLITKGAPEDVLNAADRYQEPNDAEPRVLDEAARGRAAALFRQLSTQGFRVLGIAWCDVAPNVARVTVSDERDLVFAGFAVFLDPPKESAAAAIAALGAKGVAIKILSGDNEQVTQHVCHELAIPIVGLLTGAEIERLSDEALAARLDEANLFCRVTPVQKNRVMLALKRRGHVVGFLGDGINDAPSLHTADVGISVDSAVDVAKDAAGIILLERDLAVLERGVSEGRRAFGNIMKFIMMATSSNFGNMFSMAGATLILPFLPMLSVQILLNNLLYAVSEMPIPLDEVDPETTDRPEHWDMRFIRNFMLVMGPVSSVFDFLTFGLLLLVFHAGEALFQTGWFIESLATQTLVIFVLRTRGNPLRSRPHPLLAASSIGVVGLAIGLPFTPLGRWFGFVPPNGALLAAIGGLTVVYLLLAQGAKTWLYRRWPPSGLGPAAQIRPHLPLIGRV